MFPKLGMTLHPYISKTVSRNKKVTRVASIPSPLTIRCTAQILRRPKGQGSSARAASVPLKPHKYFFRENDPFLENV